MALSSYDELLKQVASLKSENCHLRRELKDNSSHLTKLENDASNMKDVLSHIQVTFDDQRTSGQGNKDHEEHGDCGKETGADIYNVSTGIQTDDSPIERTPKPLGHLCRECPRMSHWLLQTNTIILESPSLSDENDEEVDEDEEEEDLLTEEDVSECSNKEYDDDDDFDNRSLEIDEEERNKISAQINPDDDDENQEDREIEKEEIAEKEDSEREKDVLEKDEAAFASHNSLCDDSFDEDLYQGQATAVGLEEGETSMTESAESQTVDVYALIQKLDAERKQLLQELERDDQHRHWFYNQLKSITQKMEGLQLTETYSAQTDITRRQLELEAHQIQGAMQEKLGSGEHSKLRQEARLERIRTIETEILSLQVQAKQPTCKNTKDASTTPMVGKEAFKIKPDQEDGVGGYISDRTTSHTGLSVSLATQTGEVTVSEIPDGVAPGMPLNPNLSTMYHGAWPIENAMTGSGGSDLVPPTSQDLASVISFNSTNTNSSNSQSTGTAVSKSGEQPQQLGTKVEMVYSLLSMLGTHDKDDMSRTLFAMSQSQDSCIAMRQSGCLPLLLQLLHGSDKDSGLLGKTRGSKAARARAAAALHNIVHCHHDDKRGRREARTLRLLEQIRAHCDQQRGELEEEEEESVVNNCSDMDHHPGAAIAALMKLSFDEDYRHAICTLGGLQAIAELLELDNKMSGPVNDYNTNVRRYSCMALTNLTFGDGKNKALLCSMRGAMEALRDQLESPNEDLIQAAASVLRNLSWRADLASKKILREIGAVTTLMKASMTVKKETTLKSILSALWNLSSHCSENKAEICAVEGALQFLVGLLTYKSVAKTLAIVENGGGILRNVSSQIAIREDYRQVLRKHGCLQILLHHLRSTSLTIVSNACGTLWNLSARCEEDQNALREMGAISMLRNLVHSRHKMISSGSSAALRNLLSSVPTGKVVDGDKSGGSSRPTLHVRKQRAMEAELDPSLAETCENVESPRNSPSEIHRSESEPRRFVYHLNGAGASVGPGTDGTPHRQEEDGRKHMTRRQMMPRNGSENGVGNRVLSPQRVARAGSLDSVGSTHSDISHDRTRAHTMLAKSSHLLHKRQGGSLERKEQPGRYKQSTPADHKPHSGVNNSLSKGGSLINNVPAHVRRPHPGNYHRQNPQHQQHNPTWHTMPNSRIVQYMHEVALYAGVEPSGPFPGQQSLTQSAPSQVLSSQPMHYPNQHNHPSFLERLAKSSSGISGSSKLTSSTSSTNNSLNNSVGGEGRHDLSCSVDDETDQPVNYSLKYQDGVVGVAKSPIPHFHPSISHVTPVMSTPTFRLPNSLTGSMKEQSYLINTSGLHEQGPNNSSNSNIMINPAILTPHRPLPSMGNNVFHTPHPYRPVGATPSHHPSQLLTSQAPYSTSSPHPVYGYPYSSAHQMPNPSLPSTVSKPGVPGFPSQGQIFNTKTSSYHNMPAAHQNNSHANPIQQFSSYAETDLDSVDQPTDFSLRYSEVSEENCHEEYQEQPINYSMRFRDNKGRENQEMTAYRDQPHCVECKYAEARRANERLDNSSNDDQVRTFYTEGTPYLSTATSLTDLSQAGKQDREGEVEEEDEEHDERCEIHDANQNSSANDLDLSKNTTVVDADKTLTNCDMDRTGCKSEMDVTNSSCSSQTTDRHTGSTLVGLTDKVVCSSKSEAQVPDPNNHILQTDSNEGALDQTKTYCEEGTPVCFSRVSSLSSLHSSEAREGDNLFRQNSNPGEKMELACIEEAETPDAMVVSVIENKNVAPVTKPGSNLRRTTSETGQKGDKEAKTVTFDENHQVEETPLMFSRSSSPESLSSFDTQSMHSSVVSEYSRRASEVVSPSEIPDSPSESMPPSPRRTHSPTRRFKDFASTPKSSHMGAKQSLDFNKTPSTIKAEPFMSFAAFDEEDKPINFAMRNPEMGLLPTFPGFDEDQPINFSSFQREQEPPPLTFSTFQKNIQPPTTSTNTHPNASRLLTPRAKMLPTLVEQSAETESSSGKSEVPVVYAEEGSPPNFSETTSLSGLTVDNETDEDNDVTERPKFGHGNRNTPMYKPPPVMAPILPTSGSDNGNLERPTMQLTPQTGTSMSEQHQMPQAQPLPSHQGSKQVAVSQPLSQSNTTVKTTPQTAESWIVTEKIIKEQPSSQPPPPPQAQEPNLPKIQERESGSEIVLKISTSKSSQIKKEKDAYPTVSNPVKPWSPATEHLKQEDRDSSMSEVSEGEEDILAQCISSGMPTPSASSSARKMRRSSSDNNIKKKSGIPTKADSSLASKNSSSKSSSIPKPASPPVKLPQGSKQGSSSTGVKQSQNSSTTKPPRPSSSASSKASKSNSKPELPTQASGKSSPLPGSGRSSQANDNQNPSLPIALSATSSSKTMHAAMATNANMSSNVNQPTKSGASKNLNPVLNKVAQITSSGKPLSKGNTGPGGKSGSKVNTSQATVLPPMQEPQEYSDFNQDCVKSYATEGTPLNFSAATSLSDLSVLTHSSSSPSPKKSSSSSAKSPPTDTKSDNSSVCEENEDLLLSQMIESAMPKTKPGRKFSGGGNGGGATDYGCSDNGGASGGKQNSRDCNTSAFVPRTSNLTVVAPFHDFVSADTAKTFHDFVSVDTVKTYNDEGTPRGFSAATSLSDLTIDSYEDSNHLPRSTFGFSKSKAGKGSGSQGSNSKNISSSVGQNESSGNKAKFPGTTVTHLSDQQPCKSVSKGVGGVDSCGFDVTFSPPSNDTIHTYGVEGTPITFSRSDSLSSLGGENDGPNGWGSNPHKEKHRVADRDESDSSSSLPKERQVIGQSSEDSSVAGDKGDRPIKFTVEDTPVCFSRNSSLSSLNSIDKHEQVDALSSSSNRQEPRGVKTHPSQALETPKSVLKRSESNESLTDELADCDPTPSEQALLEQCINSAMPKSRLPRGDERAKRHSRAKYFVQKGGAANSYRNPDGTGCTNGLIKSVSLEMAGGMINGYHSGSEMGHGSQSSLSQDESSCENLMTRSCSDTTELDLDFQIPSPAISSRQSRYSSWRRQRHRSQDEGGAAQAIDCVNRGNVHYRSHSQDNENQLKHQKDISNKLAQAGGKTNTERQAYQGSLDSFEDVFKMRQQRLDQRHNGWGAEGQGVRLNYSDKGDREKLSDFAAKVREISNDNMGGLVALRDDADIDQVVFSGHNIVELVAKREDDLKEAENNQDVDELSTDLGNVTLKETDQSYSTAGDKDAAMTMDEEDEIDDNNEPVHFYMEDGDDEDGYNDDEVDYEDVYGQVNEAFDQEISPEDTERLLAENAHLIMSEIQTTKMSGSTVDEDLFIENETISLVSNDYTSDTNSEVSVTWSVTSDKTSDLSSATLADHQSQASSRGSGPKIVKPGESPRPVRKLPEEEKSVRGRRKPLYPGKSNLAVGKTTGPGGRGAGNAQGRGSQVGALKSTTGPGSAVQKKTPPRNPNVAQVSPRTRPTQGNAQNSKVGGQAQAQKNVSPRSKSAGPRSKPAGPSATAGKVGTSAVGVNSSKPTARGRGVSQGASPAGRPGLNQGKQQGKTPVSQTKTSSSGPVTPTTQNSNCKMGSGLKPKTPGRQLSKEVGPNKKNLQPASTTNNASPENKENKEQGVTLRDKKSNLATSNNRLSNSSNDSSNEPGNRNSTGSIPESWSKALDSYNFLVDTNQDGVAYKHIQMQRNAKDAPQAIKRTLKVPNKALSGCNQITGTAGNKSPGTISNSVQSKLPTASPGTRGSNVSVNVNNKNNLNKPGVNNTRQVNNPTRPISNTSLNGTSSDRKSGQNIPKTSNLNVANKGLNKTPNNNVSRSNDSLKTPNRPLTPVSSGGSRRSSNSSGSGIPTRKSEGPSPSSGNVDQNRRTASGGVGKKQVTSKIATLWKRDGSLDRSPSRESPLSSTSSSSSRLPVSTKTSPSNLASPKPSSLPPSGFKTKSATLPASSSLTGSKSRSVSDGISKSSTYEKISSELSCNTNKQTAKGGKNVKKPREATAGGKFESPESGVRRGQVFELYDSDSCHDNEDGDSDKDSISDRANESLDNNVFDNSSATHNQEPPRFILNSTSDSVESIDESTDTSLTIDSSTFRRKKREPGTSDLDLPNADETVKSMCSFNDSMAAPTSNNSLLANSRLSDKEDSLISHMNMTEILAGSEGNVSKLDKKGKQGEEKAGGKTKSKVAQGLKRLFGSGRHGKEKEKEKEPKGKNVKNSVKDSNKTKTSKHFGRDRKNDKDYDFFTKNIKIEPSTTCNIEDRLVCSQGTSTAPAPTKSNTLRTEHKISPSAIVAPFNYSPPAVGVTTSNTSCSNSNVLVVDLNTSVTSNGLSPVLTNGNQPGFRDNNQENSPDSQLVQDGDSSSVHSDKPMTKTEMLLARRRKTNLSSSRSEDGCEGEITAGCMVTTV